MVLKSTKVNFHDEKQSNSDILQLKLSTNYSNVLRMTVRFSFQRCMSKDTDLGSEFLILYILITRF